MVKVLFFFGASVVAGVVVSSKDQGKLSQ